ncbi:DUF6314 family protein [Ruegeria sp. 2012CJ41-6]|uniref:DUF6314 family protein n=1 Tax=Ruegeria spongiae TaxID=2942209 RepID=A0ABT0Q5A7_9RHOB|nr:DUF6314 family protein [Ruegeria spongiae]MCL6285053.1 DUF6314 family protein [Ruegeria spongiae]
MTLPGCLGDFAGDWRITREITDARAGQVLHAEGTASLVWKGDALIYGEALRLQVPGQAPMQATRRYLWQQGQGGIDIRFEDGRFFHHLALGQDAPHDHHDCPPDSYDAAYDFTDWPVWSVVWTVSGPRKSYVMKSHYQRLRDS